jgi:hypothetical protein
MKDKEKKPLEAGAHNFSPLPNQPLEPRSTQHGTLKVGTRSINIIGWIAVVLLTGFTIAAGIAQQYIVVVLCAFFILLGASLILVPGYFLFDEESVTWKNIFIVRRIYWREMKRIEFSSDGRLILRGDNNRLTVFPPSMWSGPDKEAAYALLQKKIAESGLTPYPA